MNGRVMRNCEETGRRVVVVGGMKCIMGNVKVANWKVWNTIRISREEANHKMEEFSENREE